MASVAVPTRLCLKPGRIDRSCPEADIYRERLPLADARVLELGCGAAEHTRTIASTYPGIHITALEVDERQHEKNLASERPPNLVFKFGGAQAIPEPDNAFDVVLLFKSLHHVPGELLDRALAEIRRVLKPAGLAYISEPIFDGPFNDILRLFHDEQQVRQQAFDAIVRAVDHGVLESVDEIFFNAPVRFADFADFERRIIGATHSDHALSDAVYATVRSRMEAVAGPDGIHFEAPMRVDILRKPA